MGAQESRAGRTLRIANLKYPTNRSSDFGPSPTPVVLGALQRQKAIAEPIHFSKSMPLSAVAPYMLRFERVLGLERGDFITSAGEDRKGRTRILALFVCGGGNVFDRKQGLGGSLDLSGLLDQSEADTP